jgi:hypothetical protein
MPRAAVVSAISLVLSVNILSAYLSSFPMSYEPDGFGDEQSLQYLLLDHQTM